ncbi:helix-turn-helix domain-containing protein [Pseudomonas mohnii]|uniref:helix-turn-helix domain-containing protein n=1 Tax=Pseudomonas mohnii TaxID=395600 RepID=UPI0018C668FA|nr:helix-turn-helix domain-containing protein [Pseudomonas mohnii]MBH8614351.1 helix-turn-helix domain-containing protein [Pseudomonas mohnii]
MQLRRAYANTLRFLRERKGLNQLELAGAVDASYISRLEHGQSAVTIETNEALAEALEIGPLAVLALVHGAKSSGSAREMLKEATEELERLELLDCQIPIDQGGPLHPQVAKGVETTKAVQALKADGLSQAEVARALNVSTSTVGRHWHRS